LFPLIERLQEKREVQVIASYRDPRDVSLALLDAGERARRAGKIPYSNFDTLHAAAGNVHQQIRNFQQWAALRGALMLDYDEVAFAPDAAIDRIERVLSVRSDRDAVKKYAFFDAKTLKNKAWRRRHEIELNDVERSGLTAEFDDFIRHVCEKQSPEWHDRHRARILKRAKA
jgi:hypothetical protein